MHVVYLFYTSINIYVLGDTKGSCLPCFSAEVILHDMINYFCLISHDKFSEFAR